MNIWIWVPKLSIFLCHWYMLVECTTSYHISVFLNPLTWAHTNVLPYYRLAILTRYILLSKIYVSLQLLTCLCLMQQVLFTPYSWHCNNCCSITAASVIQSWSMWNWVGRIQRPKLTDTNFIGSTRDIWLEYLFHDSSIHVFCYVSMFLVTYCVPLKLFAFRK